MNENGSFRIQTMVDEVDGTIEHLILSAIPFTTKIRKATWPDDVREEEPYWVKAKYVQKVYLLEGWTWEIWRNGVCLLSFSTWEITA